MEFAEGENVEITAENLVIRDCGKGIVQRDPASALAALGLPADTPRDAVREVLFALRSIPQTDPDARMKKLKSSKLWDYVQNSANTATVIQTLITLGPVVISGLLGSF